MTELDGQEATQIATALRRRILETAHNGGGGHIGGSLSVLEILIALYGSVMKYRRNEPDWEYRDRLIFSKGHSVLALYACLERWGMLRPSELNEYLVDGSRLPGHSEHVHIPHIEVTTGSLGHGLGIAVGAAFALQLRGIDAHTFVIVGDGECNEGSNWESCMLANQLQLRNLTVIVDNNGMESLDKTENILSVEPLTDKFRSFGFAVDVVDGHNLGELVERLPPSQDQEQPRAVIAKTIKGKGVSFAEGVPMWHFRQPTSRELAEALTELDADAQISG